MAPRPFPTRTSRSSRVACVGAPLRGFSFVELLIVVAVFGVLAALALPSIQALVQTRRSSIEVARVQAAIEGARDDARARLRCIRVRKASDASLALEELAPVSGADPSSCGVIVAS